MFVSTNVTFLEEDYMREFKPRSKMLLKEILSGTTSIPSSTRVIDRNISPSTSECQMEVYQNVSPRCSGRVMR